MEINITSESNARLVCLVSESINWITFGDNLRLELTRSQLDSILEQFENAKARQEIYEAAGIN